MNEKIVKQDKKYKDFKKEIKDKQTQAKLKKSLKNNEYKQLISIIRQYQNTVFPNNTYASDKELSDAANYILNNLNNKKY